MYIPIATITAFGFWYIFAPHEFFSLLNNPLRATGVSLSMILAVFAMQFIRKNDYGWAVFMKVLPIGLVFGLVDVGAKIVFLEGVDVFRGALTFNFVSFGVTSLVSLLIFINRRSFSDPLVWDRRVLWAGFISGALSVGALFCALVAIAYAPNPAFPGVVMILAPFWIFLLHKHLKVPDNANPYAGILIIFSAIGLLIFGGE